MVNKKDTSKLQSNTFCRKNILVACEESQRVCAAFREKGHNAFSCDILPCSGGHPEWHIQGDVLKVLNPSRQTIPGDDWYGFKFRTQDGVLHFVEGKWDLIIAHPPCTYLSNAGARHLWKGHKLNQERYQSGLIAKDFFMTLYNADCDKICVENPTPSKIFNLPKYTQTIQPYQFGHPYTKRTHLWLKGLPELKATNIVEPVATFCPSGSYSKKHGEKHKGLFTRDRARERSKTFEGIAKAMAEQWQ